MVSIYSQPDHDLLKKTFYTIYQCRYEGDTALLVIPVKCISSFVAMVPRFCLTPDGEVHTPKNEWFLVQKFSLDADIKDEEDNEDDTD